MPDPAAPAGTSSTPAQPATPAAPAAAPASNAPEPKPPLAAAPGVDPAKPADPAKAADPAATDPAKPADPKIAADPAKTADPAKPGDPPPLFKLPEDMRIAPEAATKFETFVKGKMADGKVTLTPQEIVDLYADQAREAYTRWQAQQVEQDKTWETESKQRFNAQQLAAAETGLGFLASFDPQFRELSKSFKNHPVFVNAMRIVGERLSEDSFEIQGAHPQAARKAAKDVLYPKRN